MWHTGFFFFFPFFLFSSDLTSSFGGILFFCYGIYFTWLERILYQSCTPPKNSTLSHDGKETLVLDLLDLLACLLAFAGYSPAWRAILFYSIILFLSPCCMWIIHRLAFSISFFRSCFLYFSCPSITK